ASGAEVGPLHGVPVLHKDLLETAGVRTTFGSPIFAQHVPVTDAPIVARMRAAGAIMLGKTNTPEFGAGSQTFNPVFGATRNPYDLSRTCGGSSGGSAVALACGMAALATGTDMGGSLRNPASFCNVVGLRPSPGLVPMPKAGEAWDALNVHGVMGRNVGDVAFAMSVLAPGNWATGRAADPRGVRIAFSEDGGGLPVAPEVRDVMRGARQVLESLGYAVVDDWPDFSGADVAFETIRAAAFAAELGALYAHEAGRMKLTVRQNIEAGQQLSPDALRLGWELRAGLRRRVAAFLDQTPFLVLPTVQVPPFPLEQEYVAEIAGVQMRSYVEWMRSCSRISVAGVPAISIPAGFTPAGLPVGMQIVGRAGSDAHLLALATAIEHATGQGSRRPPLFGRVAGE
ncbi:MAG TPA: amidase family protein, partial [Tepidiformaceae bacterium]|nr:amidase family protein [Tepidiformaceae bacterium]